MKLEELLYDGRVPILLQGATYIVEKPLFGMGLGNFIYEALEYSKRQYMHNIFGEITVETGFVGLVMFLVLLVLAVRRWYVCSKCSEIDKSYNITCWSIQGITIFVFVAAQVSGDIVTNYMLWVSIALLDVQCHIYRKALVRVKSRPAPLR
jgi:O-antigen ligase